MSLQREYTDNIKEQLKKDLSLKSIDAVPAMTKIVLNMGVGRMRENKAFIEECRKDLEKIAGQKPVSRKAKVSISNFKLRQGQLTGIAVTLRGDLMWNFYEKLVTITLPRVKDFRGLSTSSFDGHGNYSIGFKEHLAFAEIDANKVSFTKPLQVTICTSAKTDKSALSLLRALAFPFKKK